MLEATVSLLTTWNTFYGIIGSAAAALTGLMFVVVTLIERFQTPKANDVFAAFNTPNVAHFCAALLIAGTISAPWQMLWYVSFPLGLCGICGVIYAIIVGRRMYRQKSYQPVFEDWLWHTALPFVSYTTLVVAAILLLFYPAVALFGVGAATLLLLFIGIHNAWDTITYISFNRTQVEDKQDT